MKKLLLATLVLALLAMPTLAHPIQVIGPDNEPAADVTVRVYDSKGLVAEGSTNSSGWVDLALKNATLMFQVIYNTTTDAIVVAEVTTYENESLNTPIIINMTTLYSVKLFSTVITVNVSVREPETGTELTYATNESMIYTTDRLNYTFPREVSKFPYRYVLKEIKYDGSVTKDNYVTLTPTTSIEVTAVYERQWWITLTTEQLIIVVLAAGAIILVLLAVTRGGAKAIMERRREYWVR